MMIGLVLLAAAAAAAPAQPAVAAPPAWVEPVRDLPVLATEGAPAVQTVLNDNQSRLSAQGGAYYNRRVWKVTRDEGLRALGTQSLSWDPDTETLTLHTLAIRRGGESIDLLADRGAALVLRREPNLERATLDGRLTFTRQLDGLRVGDVVDIAWTVDRHNPVTAGRTEDSERFSGAGVVGRYRARVTWPDGLNVRWRQAPGGIAPVERRSGGWTELLTDISGRDAPQVPAQAPGRYSRPGAVEIGNYDGWADVSRRLAPLFARAATVAPDSPVGREAAAIMARVSDPKARAFAALQLVEQQTRYVALLMGQGGYTPATADETWARRFGDCKAKTALLLALLHAMEIEAVPALTTLPAMDVADWQLPRLGAFNHMLVRATIGGKAYWLDGTRTADRAGLDALDPPSWRYALPVTPAGAAIERVEQRPPSEPFITTAVTIDASAGMAAESPATMTVAFSGPTADAMAAAERMGAASDFERGLRGVFSRNAPWLALTGVTWASEPGARRFRLVGRGKATLEWRDNPDLHRPELVPPLTGVSVPQFARRTSGAPTDMPYALPFPADTASRTEILLPAGGQGFEVRGGTVDARASGFHLRRSAALTAGKALYETRLTVEQPETAVADVTAENARLRRLAGDPQRMLGPVSATAP